MDAGAARSGGGTGRHAGLRSLCLHRRGGSSPPPSMSYANGRDVTRPRRLSRGTGASLVVVEVEAVSVEVLDRELPQPPRLRFQGPNDVRSRLLPPVVPPLATLRQ